jgi:hypothetical protein
MNSRLTRADSPVPEMDILGIVIHYAIRTLVGNPRKSQ